jgi:PPOX class probable F420-dependent enzyme
MLRAVTIADEKYVRLTTFRRDGQAVSTPVWVVQLDDGQVGFWTSSGSGKAKRLAHTERVTVQASDARGKAKADAPVIEATAKLVDGAELEAIHQRVVAKYGVQTKVTKLLATIVGTVKGNRIPYGDRGVVITLPAGA